VPEDRWRIALVDGGLDLSAWPAAPLATQRFAADDATAAAGEAGGHGARMARILAGAAVLPELLVAQVFEGTTPATAADVAAGIDWSLQQGARLLLLALGLAADRRPLAQAVQRAVATGAIIVAASPARGAVPFPAGYPGVIRASGDARCGPDEISALGTAQADFGGCPVSPGGGATGGASAGAAHVARFILGHCPPGATVAEACAVLRAQAAFHGPERRANP
jgi:hypothetical protein